MINFFPPALNCKLRLAKKEKKKKKKKQLADDGWFKLHGKRKEMERLITRKQNLYYAGKNIREKKSDFSAWKAVAWADTVL